MSAAELVQQLINALVTGGVTALLALGLGLVFSILGMINFAHGEIVVLGGYAMWATSQAGLPWPIVLLSAPVASVAAAVLLERVAFRPLRRASPVTMLVTSFAIAFLIQSVLSLTTSGRAVAVTLPAWIGSPVQLGAFQAPLVSLVAAVLAPALMLALWIVLRRTRVGIALRAAADDPVALALTGVRVNRVVAAGFAISGLLAGFAAIVLFARSGSVGPTSGTVLGITAFIAVVLGGASTLQGAVVGGYLLGIAQVALQAFLPAELLPFRDALLFGGVLVVLLVRPQGLVVLRERLRARPDAPAVSVTATVGSGADERGVRS